MNHLPRNWYQRIYDYFKLSQYPCVECGDMVPHYEPPKDPLRVACSLQCAMITLNKELRNADRERSSPSSTVFGQIPWNGQGFALELGGTMCSEQIQPQSGAPEQSPTAYNEISESPLRFVKSTSIEVK